jgi:hypothetical protein
MIGVSLTIWNGLLSLLYLKKIVTEVSFKEER